MADYKELKDALDAGDFDFGATCCGNYQWSGDPRDEQKCCGAPTLWCDHIMAVMQERDIFSKDSARYQWLKRNGGMCVQNIGGFYRVVDGEAGLILTDFYDSFDEAIDAAMEGEK